MNEPSSAQTMATNAAHPSAPTTNLWPSGERGLRVRPMQADDIGNIMPLEKDIYPFPWTAGNFRDALIAGYCGWILEGGHAGVSRPGSLLGYAVVMHVLDEAHLMNLSISASLQRQGYGRKLLAWLARNACERGAVGMFLEVRPSNLPALALYESAGFRRIGLRRNYYPNGSAGREDAIVMRCPLSDGVTL